MGAGRALARAAFRRVCACGRRQFRGCDNTSTAALRSGQHLAAGKLSTIWSGQIDAFVVALPPGRPAPAFVTMGARPVGGIAADGCRVAPDLVTDLRAKCPERAAVLQHMPSRSHCGSLPRHGAPLGAIGLFQAPSELSHEVDEMDGALVLVFAARCRNCGHPSSQARSGAGP